MFIVLYIHISQFYIKCSLCLRCNQTLRQFTPLNDDRLRQLVDCRELSTLIDYLLKGPQHNRPDLIWAVWGLDQR